MLAALGIALVLHGKRALGPRALDVAAIATSIFMNLAARRRVAEALGLRVL